MRFRPDTQLQRLIITVACTWLLYQFVQFTRMQSCFSFSKLYLSMVSALYLLEGWMNQQKRISNNVKLLFARTTFRNGQRSLKRVIFTIHVCLSSYIWCHLKVYVADNMKKIVLKCKIFVCGEMGFLKTCSTDYSAITSISHCNQQAIASSWLMGNNQMGHKIIGQFNYFQI